MGSLVRKALAVAGLTANIIHAAVRVPHPTCSGQVSAVEVLGGILYFTAAALFLSLAFNMKDLLKMRIVCSALLLTGLSLVLASLTTSCASSPIDSSATQAAAFAAFCYFALASATLYEISSTTTR